MNGRAPLRLTVFGMPALHDPTGSRIPLGVRATALLTVLALEPTSMGRAGLAHLLWPDRHPEQARASLRQCLLELRHAVERRGTEFPIAAEAGRLALRPDRVTSDLADIEAAAATGDRAALARALSNATPRALVAELEPSVPFVEWVATVRIRVGTELRRATTALLARGEDAADEGDWASSAELARAWLAHDPTCPLAAAVLRGRIAMSDAPEARTPLPPLALPADAPPALYVERFGHGGAAEDAALAQAIREEVVSALSRFREVRVVVLADDARADAHGGSDTAYLLSVTLRPVSDGTVVTARLAAMSGGQVLWASRFPLVADRIDAAIDEIVERMAAAVAPTVENHIAAYVGNRPTGTLYSRYLSGRVRSMRPPDHAAARAAADELERIVAEAPDFSSAKLALARLYNTDFAWTRAMSSGDEERARALLLARSAVAGDRGHAHGHSLLGWCHLRQHEWGAARRCFDEAIRLNPFHAERLMEVAYGLIHLGDLDAGETLLRRCLAINPVSTDGFHFDMGMLALIRGDPLLATEHLSMIVDPDCWGAIATALAAVQGGVRAEATIARARSAVSAVWMGGLLPNRSALSDWVVTRHPFRLPQHLERYVDGLERIGG